jgi:predicted PurR-regulated permease PerM
LSKEQSLKDASETTRLASHQQPATQRSPLEWLRWVPATVLGLVTLAVLLIGGRVIFLPFLCSVTLAYLLVPWVKWFEQRGWSRATAVVLTMTLTGLLLVLALVVILPGIWQQVSNSYEQALELFAHPQKAAPILSKLKQIIPAVYADYIETLWVRTAAKLNQTKLSEVVLNWLQGGLFQLVNYTASLFDLLLVPFFVYYLLADYRSLRGGFEAMIPPRLRPQVLGLTNQINLVLSSYVRGQLLIAAIMSSLYVIGFVLLRVPIAVTLGVISGLLNFIPYLGTLTGLTLSLTFLILDGAGVTRLLGVLILFASVQSLEGYFLTPRLLGDRLNLSPLWVLVGLLVGGNLFGLIGIVLALPVLAVAKVLLGFLTTIYQGSEFYSRSNSTLLTGEGIPFERPMESNDLAKLGPAIRESRPAPRLIITSSELASRNRERE